jgi:hypothetical protein
LLGRVALKKINHRDTEDTEEKVFLWPGDDGQRKEPPPPAKALEPESNH